MAQGREVPTPVAYEISKQKPDFLVALGDIVYPTGRINQYMSYFWGTYNNVAEAGPKAGAPLFPYGFGLSYPPTGAARQNAGVQKTAARAPGF